MRWKWIFIAGVALVLVFAVVLFNRVALAFSNLSLLMNAATTPSGHEPPPVVVAPSRIAPTSATDRQRQADVGRNHAQPGAPGLADLATVGKSDMHRGKKRGAKLSRVLGAQLREGLTDLNPRLASCLNSETEGGFGGSAGLGDKPNEQRILLLDVATLDGKVEVLDASLAMPRSTSDEFVECARRVLRGQIVAVPNAKAGDRAHIAIEIVPVQSPRPEEILERARQAIGADVPARR